jgi:hypothetical protein
MDFITKFPRISKQHDSIMVVVEKITKVAHFIPVKSAHKATNIVDIFMHKFVRFHGVPKTIVSDEIPSSPQTFGRGYSKDLEKI